MILKKKNTAAITNLPLVLSDTGMPSVDASGSNSSLMDPEDMLQAVESDESL